MKYRKKPVVVEAHQWFTNGDHPEDKSMNLLKLGEHTASGELSEGKVVRYYRHPKADGLVLCKHCRNTMHHHGWIDTLEGGHIVCPGDWIITGVEGEFYPVKEGIFRKTYERVYSAHEDKAPGGCSYAPDLTAEKEIIKIVKKIAEEI